MDNPSKAMSTAKKIAAASLFTALAVTTNYLLFPIWNVKLMDVVVFLSAYILGLRFGVIVAVFSWLIYGVFNPLGFSFPILAAVACCEVFYASAGAFCASRGILHPLKLGVIGLVATLGYDLVTNAVSGVLFTNTLWPGVLVGILTMNFPVPLGLLHQASNLLLFSLLPPKTVPRLTDLIASHTVKVGER
ncbi:MAG: hypothetical protein HA494_02170 [Thaumarchaeota archaeon]|jgi:uncharacterized membrane protein|nr:hypothetical protein [Nitrososphaerota archaeon]